MRTEALRNALSDFKRADEDDFDSIPLEEVARELARTAENFLTLIILTMIESEADLVICALEAYPVENEDEETRIDMMLATLREQTA